MLVGSCIIDAPSVILAQEQEACRWMSSEFVTARRSPADYVAGPTRSSARSSAFRSLRSSDSKCYWTLTVNSVDPLSCLKRRDGCDHGKGGFGAIELLVLSMTP